MGAADTAIAYALSQRGKPYSTVPDGVNTFDCSLLVQKAYQQAGVQLPRTTFQQILVGTPVARGDLQPGDLVFPSIDHVQLYLGNGQVVEAAHPGTTVRSVPMWGYWAGRRVAAPGNVTNPGSNGASGGNQPTGGVIPVSDPTGIKTAVGNGLTLAGWALMVAGGTALMVAGTMVALAHSSLGGKAITAATRGVVPAGAPSKTSTRSTGSPSRAKPASKPDDQAPDEDGYQPRHSRGAGRRRKLKGERA